MQTERVSRTCRYRNKAFPVGDVALALAVITDRESTSFDRERDRVLAARCQRHDVVPVADLAGARRLVPSGEHPSVACQGQGVNYGRPRRRSDRATARRHTVVDG